MPCPASPTRCACPAPLNTSLHTSSPLLMRRSGDVMGRFHNALYLGDVRERLRILEDAGAVALVV